MAFMAFMASKYDAHGVAGWFRVIAFAEAVTWVGLLIGMSGARITLHAALQLAQKGSGYAVAALCGAGGQGDALILRRP